MNLDQEIDPRVILEDKTNSGDIIDRTIPGNSAGGITRFGARLGDLIAGRIPMPDRYHIQVEMLSFGAITKRTTSLPAILRTTSRYPTDYNRGLGLKVSAVNSGLFGGGEEKIPHIALAIYRNPETDQIKLAGDYFSSSLRMGRSAYHLEYVSMDGSSAAVLKHVHRISFGDYGNPDVINFGSYLSSSQIKRLDLENQGFPKIVDWLRTAAMYVLGIAPNSDGVLPKHGQPLTALDIHHQTLIPG